MTSIQVVSGATVSSNQNAPAGTFLIAEVNCPALTKATGGGVVTTAVNDTGTVQQMNRVSTLSSFPGSNSWAASAAVHTNLANGVSLRITPYVICVQ